MKLQGNYISQEDEKIWIDIKLEDRSNITLN